MTDQLAIDFPVPRVLGASRGYGHEPEPTSLSVDAARARVLELLGDGEWHPQSQVFEAFDDFDDEGVRPSAIGCQVLRPMVDERLLEERKDYYGTAEIGPGYAGYGHSWRLARHG